MGRACHVERIAKSGVNGGVGDKKLVWNQNTWARLIDCGNDFEFYSKQGRVRKIARVSLLRAPWKALAIPSSLLLPRIRQKLRAKFRCQTDRGLLIHSLTIHPPIHHPSTIYVTNIYCTPTLCLVLSLIS